MGHLTEGGLRRLLDDPDSIADLRRRHLEGCPRCGAALEAARRDMAAAAAMLSGPAPEVSTGLALRQTVGRLGATPGRGLWGRALGSLDALRIRPARMPLAAGAAVILVGGLAAASFANLTRIFEPTRIAPITVNSQELRALPDLSAYGIQKAGPTNEPRPAADLAAAEAATKLTLTLPANLPAGVAGPPSFATVGLEQGSFTFSAARAASHARALGKTLPPMPPGMDGSTLYVNAGPAIVATYGADATGTGGLPSFAVAVAKAPTVTTGGSLTVRQIEDYLISQPDFPPALAAQIRSLGDLTSTLPIPIPETVASSAPVTVRGVRGVVITEKTGLGSAVVWEEKGLVHAVGGLISRQQAIDAAAAIG